MGKASSAIPLQPPGAVQMRIRHHPRALKTINIKSPPADLKGKALEQWNELGATLAEANQLAQIDRNLFAAYCVVFARWCAAEERVAELGLVVQSPTGTPGPNPFLRIADAAIRQLAELGDKMGLSPAARNELHRKS